VRPRVSSLAFIKARKIKSRNQRRSHNFSSGDTVLLTRTLGLPVPGKICRFSPALVDQNLMWSLVSHTVKTGASLSWGESSQHSYAWIRGDSSLVG